MAFNVAHLVIGLGAGFIALGLGLWFVGVPLVYALTCRLYVPAGVCPPPPG